jgi:hypothetical protein
MDQGIWATWYDLEDGGRDGFLQWMHEHYLPSLKMRPGFAWVAHYQSEGGGPAMRQVRDTLITRPDDDIGSGSQFLMLAGAASPHTFLNPSVLVVEREQPADVRAMLAKRRGVRTAIFSEEYRVSGPAAGARPAGTTPGPAIQMGSFRVRSIEEEFDLGCWYAQYRLPHMAQMPGSIASRKLICVAGWAKHAVMYEFTSLEARLANFEEPHESHALDPKEWTGRIVRYTVHAPGSPTVGVRIWPPVEPSGQ